MFTSRHRALIGRWVPLLAWMLAIFYMSARPVPPSPIPIARPLIFEAAFHFAEYFGLTILMHRALSTENWLSGPDVFTQPTLALRLLIAGAVSLGYAVSDELHQHFVPGRTLELIDLTVDGIGVVAALSLILIWTRIRASSSMLRVQDDSEHERRSAG